MKTLSHDRNNQFELSTFVSFRSWCHLPSPQPPECSDTQSLWGLETTHQLESLGITLLTHLLNTCRLDPQSGVPIWNIKTSCNYMYSYALIAHVAYPLRPTTDVPVPLIIGWSQLLDLRRASSWLAQIIRSTTLVALNSSVWRMQKPHGNHGFHRHDLVCQHINLGAIWRICLFENFTLKRDGAHLWVAMIVLSVYEHHSQWTSISS